MVRGKVMFTLGSPLRVPLNNIISSPPMLTLSAAAKEEYSQPKSHTCRHSRPHHNQKHDVTTAILWDAYQLEHRQGGRRGAKAAEGLESGAAASLPLKPLGLVADRLVPKFLLVANLFRESDYWPTAEPKRKNHALSNNYINSFCFTHHTN